MPSLPFSFHIAASVISPPGNLEFPHSSFNTRNDAFYVVSSWEISVDVLVDRKLRKGRGLYELEVGESFCKDELN